MPRHRAPLAPFEHQSPIEMHGTATNWEVNHHGDIHGIALADGSLIRFPPHRASEVLEAVQLGDDVTVCGFEHCPPAGDMHTVAIQIETTRGVVSLDAGRPPRRPPSFVGSGHVPIADRDRPTAPRADIERLEQRLFSLEESLRDVLRLLQSRVIPDAENQLQNDH